MERRTPRNARRPEPAGTANRPNPRGTESASTFERRTTRWAIGLAMLLSLATLVLYWPATANPFIDFDDPLYVTENPHVRQGLNWTTFAWAWTSLDEANWHPLAWLSHLVDASLYGAGPDAAWGHHLSGIAIHAVNSGLALWVLFAYTRRLVPSVVVAGLFAWHPLHVESVAWISERKDVLSGLFFWLTLAAYLRYTQRTESWSRWLLVIGTLALGLAAKPMLVTVPFVLLLLDYWPLERWEGGADDGGARRGRFPLPRALALVREKLPLFGLSAASCVITYIAQHQWGAVGSVEDVPISSRLINSVTAYVSYLQKAFVPTRLAIFYPYPEHAAAGWELILSAAVLVVASGVAIAIVMAGRQRWGWFPVGWFWYLGMLVPVIGLVQVGSQAMADRYTYLPLVGIFIIVTWGGAAVAARWPSSKPAWIVGAVVVLCASMWLTREQIGYWRSRIDLYQHALQVTERNATAHTNLGVALFEQGAAEGNRQLIDQAASHFQQAISFKQRLGQAHNGLGLVYTALGNPEKAIAEYEAAYALDPDEAKVANNLAWALATSHDARLRNPRRAIELAEQACQRRSQDPSLLDTLAAAHAAAGDFETAVRVANQAEAMALAQGQSDLASGIAARRALYGQGRGFIEPPLQGDSQQP